MVSTNLNYNGYNAQDLIKRTEQYVKMKLADEPSGHDWFHIQRVLNVARKIQKVEGGDLILVELTALLHNLGDNKTYGFSEKKGSLVLCGMMDVIGIEDHTLRDKIIKITNESKYGGYETKRPVSIESKIIQDANFLDTLGAIGVARHFASGGFYGRSIYNPEVKVREKMSKKQYEQEKKKGTSLNNFYEKAFRIVELLNTETAKKIADQKIKFTKLFVEQFLKEWKEYNN